jgi:hypothetical protein
MDGRLYGAERIARGGSVLRSIPCARDLNRIQSEACREVEEMTLVLSTDSDLFKFLKGMSPDDVGSAR